MSERSAPLWRRISLVLLVLGVGLGGMEAWQHYLASVGPLPSVPLQKPLVELPLAIDDWRGSDRPIEDPGLRYADEHVHRTYRDARSGQTVQFWAIYSREGADRGHHPEVCMAVAGQPEDPAGRGELEVEGHPAPIQQYRFGHEGQRQWVYYWHYTLLPPPAPGTSGLQRFHQRARRRPASVTLEVFAEERIPGEPESVRDFVRLIDRAVQPHLGTDAVRGSRRLPVTLVPGEPH